MKSLPKMKKSFLILILFASVVNGQSQPPFISSPLIEQGDHSTLMVKGIERYLDREIAASEKKRVGFWHPDFSDKNAYEKSMAPNREHLAGIIGAVDKRVDEKMMEYIATPDVSAKVIETDFFIGYAIRWSVIGEIHGEGFLLQPKGMVKSRVVAIPDADQTPEMLIGLMPGLSPERQYARRLAENGCQVIIPSIIDRSCEWSGNSRLKILTNQTHREWIYRQAYTFGKHIIGFEVQKVLAAVDWFALQNLKDNKPIGVAGWGEGGLLRLLQRCSRYPDKRSFNQRIFC